MAQCFESRFHFERLPYGYIYDLYIVLFRFRQEVLQRMVWFCVRTKNLSLILI